MKKEKVLHVLTSNSFSGAENVVCMIIENNTKYDMYYCCPSGPIETILKEKNIKYVPLKHITPLYLKKITKKYQINIIHAHDFKASLICAMSGFCGKIISQLHYNAPFMKTKNIYSILYKLSIKKFHHIICVSNAVINEAYFKSEMENKSVVIENVINSQNIISKSNEYEYGKNYDLAFFGRLTNAKNPKLFINLVYKLSKEINIKSVMIGSGDLYKKCKKNIKKLGIEKNIELLGFKSNPFPIIKNSKIVVMPSIYEGFGLTAIESMCLNVPVINSGVGGLSTIFKNNKNYICKSFDEYYNLCFLLLTDNKKYYNYKNNYSIIKPYININEWEEKIYNTYE